MACTLPAWGETWGPAWRPAWGPAWGPAWSSVRRHLCHEVRMETSLAASSQPASTLLLLQLGSGLGKWQSGQAWWPWYVQGLFLWESFSVGLYKVSRLHQALRSIRPPWPPLPFPSACQLTDIWTSTAAQIDYPWPPHSAWVLLLSSSSFYFLLPEVFRMWLWCTAWLAPLSPLTRGCSWACLSFTIPHHTLELVPRLQDIFACCLLSHLHSRWEQLARGISETCIHTSNSSLKQTGAPPWGFCQTFYHSHSCHKQPDSLFTSFWLMLIPLLLGGRKSPLMAPLPPVLHAVFSHRSHTWFWLCHFTIPG